MKMRMNRPERAGFSLAAASGRTVNGKTQWTSMLHWYGPKTAFHFSDRFKPAGTSCAMTG
jgi:hypothetical protein